jgi:hypothetical protein
MNRNDNYELMLMGMMVGKLVNPTMVVHSDKCSILDAMEL